MFALQVRRFIDSPLAAAAGKLAGSPVNPGVLTVSGFAAGLAAFCCIATDRPLVGLAFLVVSRVLAALARSLAALTIPPAGWAFLDLVLEFLLGASLPLAFALADPSRAIAAAFLVLSLAGAGTAGLARDAVAARRGLCLAGRTTLNSVPLERTVVFVALAVVCLVSHWFGLIAYGVGVLCFCVMGIRVANASESLA